MTGIEFKNCDNDITADQISVLMYMMDPDYGGWISSSSVDLNASTLEWDLSEIAAEKDDMVIGQIGYQMTINIDLTDVELGTSYILNKDEPEENPATDISLNKTELSLYVDDTETLKATVKPKDTTDEVTWESSNNKVATVEDGKVTAVGKGTATITATAGDVSATCEVTVKIAATKLTLTDINVGVGKTATIECAVTPADAEIPEITYESSDETIFKVVDNKVEGVKTGTATLTATATVKGEKLTETCKVNVSNPATKITLADMSVLVGAEKAIVPTFTPADADKPEITYTSSDTSIFTVTEGKIKGVAAGTAKLTATATVNGSELTAECNVTVTADAKPATAVTLNKTTLELEVDGTEKLTVTVEPEDTTDNITWTSSDETVATVDETGEVTALKVGEATITAKANDDVSAACKVTVSAKTIAITSVTLDKETATVQEGETVQLTATVNPENTTQDKTVTWTTSDETIATVDNTGKVTAVKAGEAVITATAGTKSAKCTITVTAKVSEGEGTVDPDEGLIIEVDDEDITIEADADTFEDTVTKVKAEVSVSEEVADEKTDAIADAVKDILDGEESEVKVGSVISIVLKDQDGNEIQPVNGGVVTITVPYDGESNYAAYIDGAAPEFIKLAIDEAGEYASFDAKHFSDYYLVALSDEAADAVDKENGENDDNNDDVNNVIVSFDDKTYELKVEDASGWGGGFTRAAQANTVLNISGVTYDETTYGDIKNTQLTLNGIKFKNCEIEGIGASDIEVSLYMMHGEFWAWEASAAVKMTESTVTWDLSTLSAIPDSDVIREIGYQINIKGSDVEAVEAMNVGDTFKINEDSGTLPPEETTPEVSAPAPSVPEGSFTVPTTSGSSSGDNTAETTAAPVPAESEQAAPSSTEEDTSTNTTSPLATKDGGDDVQPTESGTPIPDGGNGDAGNAGADSADVGNAGAGNAEDKNAATGVTLALIPMIAAAAGVVISKKRK